jgi:NAD(P)-dependent dehydrogenase (short-subunit alcohol dehydrogenase family)
MTSSNPSARLHDRVAIVTGAASGFGLAIAQLFASHGCAVVAADLDRQALHSHFPADSSKQPASARVDGRMVGIEADVQEGADWDRLVKTASERFGRLDIVVNNAGTSYRNKVSPPYSLLCVLQSPGNFNVLIGPVSQPSKLHLKSSTALCPSTSNRCSILLARASL